MQTNQPLIKLSTVTTRVLFPLVKWGPTPRHLTSQSLRGGVHANGNYYLQINQGWLLSLHLRESSSSPQVSVVCIHCCS